MSASEETKAAVEVMAWIGQAVSAQAEHSHQMRANWNARQIAELKAENEQLRNKIHNMERRLLYLLNGDGDDYTAKRGSYFA